MSQEKKLFDFVNKYNISDEDVIRLSEIRVEMNNSGIIKKEKLKTANQKIIKKYKVKFMDMGVFLDCFKKIEVTAENIESLKGLAKKEGAEVADVETETKQISDKHQDTAVKSNENSKKSTVKVTNGNNTSPKSLSVKKVDGKGTMNKIAPFLKNGFGLAVIILYWFDFNLCDKLSSGLQGTLDKSFVVLSFYVVFCVIYFKNLVANSNYTASSIGAALIYVFIVVAYKAADVECGRDPIGSADWGSRMISFNTEVYLPYYLSIVFALLYGLFGCWAPLEKTKK